MEKCNKVIEKQDLFVFEMNEKVEKLEIAMDDMKDEIRSG